jgi:ABC-type branched-subunit amino acid transport system ATPase component/branched-subunit amino acid ABC-type transport system permease component
MSAYLPFVVIGLTTGSVYALAATGLVLTYKTSKIFNFAHGSMATVTVLLFFALVDRLDVPWRLAAAIAIIGIGPALGIGFERLGRRLTPLSTQAKVLATIGLLLFISGAVTLWGGDAFGGGRPTSAPPSLPGSLVRIDGVNIGVDQIIIVAVGLVMTVLLHLVLEHTGTGRSMRAVVENPELLSLAGRNPATARRAGWALGIGFVALSGLLLVLSPSNSVPVGDLDLLVLQAFGAAAIGGFTNLPLTYVGGLVIGVASAISTKFVAQIPVLGGLPASIPFIVLFLVLVLAPRHLAPERTSRLTVARQRLIEVHRGWRWPLGAVFAAAVLLVAVSKNVHLVYTANEAVAYAVIFLGLSLLVRTSGQVSLCQMGLAGVGAAIFAHVADAFGVPWFAAVLLGGLAAAAVGGVVAIPAIRVAGIYLAVATFGFGVLLEQFLYPTKFLFSTGQVTAPRPALGGISGSDDITYLFVALAIFVLALVLVMGVRRARLGRLLRALGDSPVALEAQGASINITRVSVFAISAFLAGVGGALLVSQENFLVATPFTSTNSLIVIAVLLTLRVGDPVSSLVAAVAFVVVPSYLSNTGQVWWLDVGFGGAAVLVSLMGDARWLPRWRWAPSARQAARTTRHRPRHVRAEPRGARRDGPGLDIRDLTVRFKGIVAVAGLDLSVRMGTITGLIGPNGAGKTTTFNACSGLVHPEHGKVLLHGEDVSSLPTAARARRGIGRTFQQVNLFDSLSVRENVALGAEGAMAGAHVLTQIAATPRQANEAAVASSDAMELVGIAGLADRQVATLSTGEKRLVELARCLAGRFDILLLDEPSSGLDSAETRRFGEILRRVVAERGVGVLLVEHNVALVVDVCSYVYVIDFGQLIFEGPSAEVMTSETVRAAYLGVSSATAPS